MNVELFPCSGGIASGFKRAGVHFDLVVEWEAEHCESYSRNIGHRPVHMDVRELLWLHRDGFRFREGVDLFVADPPCTPWSRAGKRLGVADERDMLGVTTELIRLMRPLHYLIGNVPGLDDSTQWHHLQAALAPLKDAGYCIRDFTTLDAADFGVPQRRIRPWWYGHLAGPCIRWPMPTHCDPRELRGSLDLLGLKPWVTCREALGHLPLEQLGRPVRLRKRNQHSLCVKTNGGRASGAGSTMRLEDPNHPPADPDAPHRTVTGAARGAQFMLAPRIGQGNRVGDPERPGDTLTAKASRVGAGSAHVLEWPWTRTAMTITADPNGRMPPPGHHDSGLSQPNAVVLSELAATILQGFPEDWVFFGKTKRARWSQIGQAMPPPLAHAVAKSVAEQMRATKEAS